MPFARKLLHGFHISPQACLKYQSNLVTEYFGTKYWLPKDYDQFHVESWEITREAHKRSTRRMLLAYSNFQISAEHIWKRSYCHECVNHLVSNRCASFAMPLNYISKNFSKSLLHIPGKHPASTILRPYILQFIIIV